jgi:hypothetical protein
MRKGLPICEERKCFEVIRQIQCDFPPNILISRFFQCSTPTCCGSLIISASYVNFNSYRRELFFPSSYQYNDVKNALGGCWDWKRWRAGGDRR